MTIREQIIKNVEQIETENGYMYCGKETKMGLTYYVFVDDDYVPHYYRPETVKNFHLKSFIK